MKIKDTVAFAKKIRLHALRMTCLGNSSHIASTLSMADIIAVLFGKILKTDPKNPKWEKRDRFILSKGHAGAGIYAALAEMSFFPIEMLDTHCQDGSKLSGHVIHIDIPGVELSTGSLGHGLSIGAGMALSAKLDNLEHRIFVLLSDGENDEGSTWEASLFSAHYHLSNLTAIIDYNKYQSLTKVEDTINLEPFKDKWESFGWAVREIDGHNHDQLLEALINVPFEQSKPVA